MSEQRPLLYRRRHLITLIGVDNQQISKLVKSGILPELKLTKMGKAYYRKADLERVFGIKL